jgi:hexosaminidase
MHLERSVRTRIFGGQVNVWSDLLPLGGETEYMMFPKLCAIAEALWTPAAQRDFGYFPKRLAIHCRRVDMLGVNCSGGPLE